MPAIKFGTDGWRAIIAEDFTFANVRLCAQSMADYLCQQGYAQRGLVVGYDTRFASQEFAHAVAEVAAANGVTTYLCDRPAPTPVVSYNIVARGAGGATVVTASHNPRQWNGLKYKPEYAGSASPEVVARLEEGIARLEAGLGQVKRLPLETALRQGLVQVIDPRPPYLEHLGQQVDLGALRACGLRAVVDAMYGAGAGYFPALLQGGCTRLRELHGEPNPLFPGLERPEPVGRNLDALSAAVRRGRADIGLALDGDADRLGIVDERGCFITPLQTFALLCLYLLEVRGQRGSLVRSITMTSMIDRLGQLYGVPVFATPVGFKYLGPVMIREGALAAGEESGGYAFRGNIPERDGVISGLLFLDMVARLGKRPSELVEYLYQKVGHHYYDRWDLPFDPAQRQAIQERVGRAQPDVIAGRGVERIDTQDGYRFLLQGGAWLLVRFSGTEPLLRVYAEAESPEHVERLLQEGRALAGLA